MRHGGGRHGEVDDAVARADGGGGIRYDLDALCRVAAQCIAARSFERRGEARGILIAGIRGQVRPIHANGRCAKTNEASLLKRPRDT